KLGALVAGLLVGVLLVAGYVAERSLRARQIQFLADSLEARSKLVSELIAELDLAPGNRELLAEVATRAARASEARVTLIAADGVVVADSAVAADALPRLDNHASRPEVAAALGGVRGESARMSASVGRRTLYVAVPAPGPEGGVVRLAVDLGFVEAEAAELRRALARGGLLGLALALPLSMALAGRLLRPMSELREVLSSMTRGDLRRRLPWRSRDELGEIADAIHRMAEELRARIADLTSEKEQLRAVLLGMVEGVLVVDRQGRVVLANRRLRELFGAWGEVIGRSALEMIRRTEIEQALEQAAASQEPVVLELAAGEDRDRAILMHAVRFPASGELLGTVAVFHDVTELRRLERVRREFVANVSHELKTPLTAIRGFAETLREKSPDEEQRRQYLDVILRHAGRLSDLIDDLLELSRIESRQTALDRTEVAVVAVAQGILRDLAPRLAARRLGAELRAEGEMHALADRRALEQVLLNLLDNAIKYTDPEGRIEIRVRREGDRIRLDVADTGIGIPESDQLRIFERFYRVDKARSRDLGGTGLGLAIVKHLVQAMGGEVSVRSRPGEGTTFTLTLPASTRADAHAAASAHPAPKPGLA
ncbi:MAG TPA: ATP-binding protein, partial [Candidatus Limnocylindrales bacterium]|nr:ATP-binding protein [Candidatus Limnocylindrales bacterium]